MFLKLRSIITIIFANVTSKLFFTMKLAKVGIKLLVTDKYFFTVITLVVVHFEVKPTVIFKLGNFIGSIRTEITLEKIISMNSFVLLKISLGGK